jgi:predicted MFS family arabinose efflux permease
LIEAPTYGWLAARTLIGFAIAAVLIVLFVVREARAERPMLDVTLFKNLRFSAASGAVTVAFFALFGFIFLMTQYFQFTRGFSPLSTGVHLLPVALSVGVGSILGTTLAVKIGTKVVVTTGLVLTTVFYIWVALSISTSLPYTVIAAQMVVYGLGMGLTSAPATESIMGAVSLRQTGIGSAINDTTRLVGGTLGVAVIGSVYASIFASRLSGALPSALPASLKGIVTSSIGAAKEVAAKLAATGHAEAAARLSSSADTAFIHGLAVGCLVAAGVAVVGAVMAAIFLPSQPPSATPATDTLLVAPATL